MARWIDVAGWTLLHFVWQGSAIAVAAAVGFRLLRAAAPHVRYAIAGAAMAAMLVAPAVTALQLSSSARVVADPPSTVMASVAQAVSSDAGPRQEVAQTAIRTQSTRPAPDAVLPTIVVLWFAGVVLLQLRLFGGWWRVRGLHRASLAAVPSLWQSRAEHLASLVRVRQFVRVVEAHAVDIPSVIGWWRPVILLPIGALAGLTPAQADAILVHELAHIRRHDYLVNGFQHAAETLLFYHPAVWWLSRRMRIEREHCCDGVVVQVCGDPISTPSRSRSSKPAAAGARPWPSRRPTGLSFGASGCSSPRSHRIGVRWPTRWSRHSSSRHWRSSRAAIAGRSALASTPRRARSRRRLVPKPWS